ncbi:MAG: PDZ domain-containing protein [Nitrospirales bacterium]|nr:PDZ domain-containing protein [Nitrospira sp.]MDR4462303.1 PDZ domain-containing protein [Nitrospirales bacterium]MDR4484591.1 PDZ domain-containing protein [Nitrospirales bacterium]
MLIRLPFKTYTNRCLKILGAVVLSTMVCTPWALGEDVPSIDSAAPTNPHASHPGPNTPPPSGIVGLALQITAGRIGEPARLIIRAVHPSGPAARAGLNHGEEILTVNGVAVAGKTYQEAVGLIRGEVGTSVRLGLTGPQGERTVSLIRISESVLMEQTPQSM